ncbi:MAG: hypothetical protein HZC45_06555 [Deltaproteobacteria bacterium]|nr:hypothetical protein [Deltaproteobacteria bacterium]
MKNEKGKVKVLSFSFTLFALSFSLLTAYSLLPAVPTVFAAQELLKTSKVKVGEKILLTETSKKANEEGKFVVLVLFPGPMGCRSCDTLLNLLEKEADRHKEYASFIIAGGQDILGAMNEETFELKRSYGFVTMGEAWTFIIDKEGILRKIFVGLFNADELKEVISSMIMGRKE